MGWVGCTKGEGEGERERDKKKVVGSGVVLRAQQRCAGIGFVCTKNAPRMRQGCHQDKVGSCAIRMRAGRL